MGGMDLRSLQPEDETELLQLPYKDSLDYLNDQLFGKTKYLIISMCFVYPEVGLDFNPGVVSIRLICPNGLKV